MMPDDEKPANPAKKEFYEITKTISPSKTLVEAVELLSQAGTALDLGSGAGKNTKYLLDQGFTVTAVDKDPQIQRYLQTLPQDHLQVIQSSFEDFDFGSYDLVNAQNTLPFTNKDHFMQLMTKIKGSINSGGIFVGTLFGDQDEWNTTDSKMSFVTRAQAEELFNGMKMVRFDERNSDGHLANGTPKHWHTFTIIAQKSST